MALLAPLVSPYDPYDQQLARKLIPPIWHATRQGHLGASRWAPTTSAATTSRASSTARSISLLIGISAMLISGVIGTTIGVLAGYFGGRVDMVVNFIVTTRLSMPVVLVALAVVSLIGSSLSVVIWVLGLLIWDRFAVVMRSATQQVRSREFIAAAQAVGCSTPRILLTEIAPNVLNHLIVVATLEMAHAILLEAALSFLGLGVQPPTPSWGLMISEAKGLMFFDPWLISIPGSPFPAGARHQPPGRRPARRHRAGEPRVRRAMLRGLVGWVKRSADPTQSAIRGRSWVFATLDLANLDLTAEVFPCVFTPPLAPPRHHALRVFDTREGESRVRR